MRVLTVTSMTDEGLAYAHGIRVGDVILNVGGVEVGTNVAFSRELSRHEDGITLSINRGGEDIEIAVPKGKLGLVAEEQDLDIKQRRADFQAAKLAKSVAVVTMDNIDGYTTKTVLGIVSSEYAVGMNVLKDVLVSGRDIFGGRSKVVQDAFKEAKEVCLTEIRREARQLGANAVLGVRFQHSQMSGTSTTMLLMVISGTAAVIQRSDGD